MLSNKISLVKKFVKLSKLRVVELLLVTTVPGMIVSLYSMPPLTLVLSTLAGGTLLAVSANVMNQVFEIERDKLMQRTSDRPLVTGELTRATGIVFSVLTGIIGFIVLYLLTTPTAAYIGLIANQFYIFIYTLILKPRTNQNIVIGGAAGAAPVLIGWTATGSTVDIGAWLLFLLVFMWTPAHFWALSIENKTDYEQADFPMLPTQETYERSTIYIAIYSCATVLISIAAAPVLQLGIIYLLIAVFLGTNLMFKSYNLYKKRIQPIKYFVFSNTYLAVIFLGIVADIMWTLRGVAV